MKGIPQRMLSDMCPEQVYTCVCADRDAHMHVIHQCPPSELAHECCPGELTPARAGWSLFTETQDKVGPQAST